MARPKAANYDRKEALILARAAALFAERGFAATSIGDIAAACGCSKPLIYHYAASKEMLLYGLLHRHIIELQAVARRACREAGDEPLAQFEALVHHFLMVYVDAPQKHIVLMRETGNLKPALRAELAARQRELVEGVAALLARLNPALRRDPRLAKPYAMFFFGMINWTYTWYRPGGPVTVRELARMAARLFLDGFRKADPPLLPPPAGPLAPPLSIA